MANYDYKCTGCDVVFTVNKPMAEATRAETCPDCADKPATRVYTAPAGVIITF